MPDLVLNGTSVPPHAGIQLVRYASLYADLLIILIPLLGFIYCQKPAVYLASGDTSQLVNLIPF
jgi:hypothetical protein